ncbi:MAG: tetratricopeptide repeat protein [Bacteroidota bacterium]
MSLVSTLTDKNKRLFFAGILVLTIIAYSSCINGDFIRGWDDGAYLFENDYLKALNGKNLKHIFTQEEQGNYHPLTMLSYAIEYQLFGMDNPVPYHINNLILHLLITAFVFYFIFLLTKNYFISFITMLLFGIHPIHVESVAWISERKDLLYTLFYLLSLINYIRYTSDNTQKKHLYYSLLFFVISCLSKGMAVSLAGVIVLIDFFQNRKFDKRTIIEKLPFFAIAVFFGLLAVKMQGSSVQPDIPYTASERFRIVTYTVIAYFQKLIAPVNLCGFYPYPSKPENNTIASYFWFFPVAVAAIAALAFYSLKYTRIIFFSLGFFLITIFLVLQILPVGGASMADRYAYIPSIGFFLLMAYTLDKLVIFLKKNMKSATTIVYILFGMYCLWLPAKTFAYCKVWDGSLNFYADVLAKYPTCLLMHYNRGNELYKDNRFDEALVDFVYNMQLDPKDYKPIQMVGAVYVKQQKYREAIGYFNRVLSMNDTIFDAYNNRATAYAMLNIHDSALTDFNKALALRPTNPDAVGNRALLLKNMKATEESSVESITEKIKKTPQDPKLYFQRGLQYYQRKEYDKALPDLDYAIKLDPVYTDALYYRAIIYDMQNRGEEAIAEYTKLIKINPKYDGAYNNRGIEYGKSGRLDLALKDFEAVQAINPEDKDAIYNIGFTYHLLKQSDKACEYIRKAADMGHQQAKQALIDMCKAK